MASATLTTVEVVKTVHEDRVVLELTHDEAETLLGVTSFIAGFPEKSRRGHTDNIASALRHILVLQNHTMLQK